MSILSKKLFFIFFVIILVVVFGKFFSLLSFPDSSIVLQKGALVKIQPKNSITQKFTSIRDGIMKIDVLLRSPGIQDGDIVEAQLMDAQCEKVLQENKLEKSFLDSENLYEFNFTRIPNSKDKSFCLSLAFSPTKDTAKSIQIFTIGEEENQPFSIRPVYKNENIWQDLSELNQRMSQYKPWFLKHYFLDAIIILFLLGTVILVITLI